MKCHRFFFRHILALPLIFGSASGQTLRIDFNDFGFTQGGWQAIASANSELGDSWSKRFPGGIGLDVDAIGSVSLDDRDRGSNNGGGNESTMWRDFLFANGSFSGNPGSGIRLSFTGLQPNTGYPVKIWAFDAASTGGRAADWSGGGSDTERLTFNTPPTTLFDNVITLDVTTDADGEVTIEGVVSATNPNTSHNVFINGLEIGDPVVRGGPTDLEFSGVVVAKSSPVGRLVGSFSTTDPTPGDTFSYSLVQGPGDSNNAEFEIVGDELRTDRELNLIDSGTVLSFRARTTDSAGLAFDKIFTVIVVNDADQDGLDDDWELEYFPNILVASGEDDGDNDDLDNLAEQEAQTNPTESDTDGDGLNDGGEVNTYDTNPLVADTDGDGLGDAEEVNGTGGYVTNPNLADTDDDGFNDSLELSEGTDPTDESDFPDTLLPLKLNEILTRNDTGIQDGFNQREDWIEIFNPNQVAVNLDAYHLTDNPEDPVKWNFPEVSIPAQGYLLVFASGADMVDPDGNPHTNFRLNSNGEFLAIVRPNGTTVDDSFAPEFPEQFTDVSYGLSPGGGSPVFFEEPTPGTVNNVPPFPGVVKDTNFSIDRGFYDSPFQLAITSDTPGAVIRYTLDGTPPTPTTGTIYSGPISIETTSTVRALATFGNWLPTNVDTHTYLFIENVVRQPEDPPNWPSNWGFDSEVGGLVASDYEMDPRVVDNTNGLGVHTVQEALRDIPTVAISMRQQDITGGNGGVLTNPRGRFERECSVEYILPDGTTGFQEDCKIETHGNSSRRPFRMQKHSMRLTFSSTVGIPKLNYPLFPDSDVTTFNKLVLRACFTDSWALNTWSSGRYRPNDSLYIRDVWMKESMTDMGHASGHGNFVHLYYNGLYFGIHNLTDRLEDDWYADHIGGKTEDWQVYADFSPALVPPRWNAMMNILRGDIRSQEVYEEVQNYIDLDNYMDYMILHFYGDSEDWPTKNAYTAVNEISGDGRFRFQVWDQEIALDKFSWNRYTSNSGAGQPFQRLRLNTEFQLRFADRVHYNLNNGGPLSEGKSVARFLRVANMIDKAIVAESARWGDTQANTPYGMTAQSSNNIDADYYPPTINNPIYFTREQHWLVERDVVTDHYIPILHDQNDSRSIIRELQARSLYPNTNPPVLSQHGGIVPIGFELKVDSEGGEVYYTTDGSDPRLTGGEVNPGAIFIPGPFVQEELIAFESDDWKYLATGEALSGSDLVQGNPTYDDSDWKHPEFDDSSWNTGTAMLGFGSIGSISLNTLITPPNPRPVTYYFRRDFEVTDADQFLSLDLEIIRDDGAVIYLNGKEIGRTNLPDGIIDAETRADNSRPEDEVVSLETVTLEAGDLVEGINTIAIALHQSSPSSSDLGIDFRLEGTKPNGDDSSIILNETSTVKTRVLQDGEWSALTEAQFIVGTAAAPGNLIISEIYYNPPGDDTGREWIELMNISSSIIDLTGVSLVGIDYTFPAGILLAPGQRIVIVEDQEVFASLYETDGILIAPGIFTGSLNNGGEELALIDSTGLADIQRFSYSDESPWPTLADGGGASLVLLSPGSNPNPAVPASWRASFDEGGNPGGSDAESFTGDPDADEDGDGLTALLEYAMGSIEGDQGPSPESQLFLGSALFGDPEAESLTVTFRRNPAAEDAVISVEASPDLADWVTLQTEFVSAIPNDDGTETVTYRSLSPLNQTTREFIRLKVWLLP